MKVIQRYVLLKTSMSSVAGGYSAAVITNHGGLTSADRTLPSGQLTSSITFIFTFSVWPVERYHLGEHISACPQLS